MTKMERTILIAKLEAKVQIRRILEMLAKEQNVPSTPSTPDLQKPPGPGLETALPPNQPGGQQPDPAVSPVP